MSRGYYSHLELEGEKNRKFDSDRSYTDCILLLDRRVRRSHGRDTCGFPQSTTTDALVVKPLLNLSRFIIIRALTPVSLRDRHQLTLRLGYGGIVLGIRLPAPSGEIKQLGRVAQTCGWVQAGGWTLSTIPL